MAACQAATASFSARWVPLSAKGYGRVSIALGVFASLWVANPLTGGYYGSSPAAIAASVQAERMGKTAVVVSPETRIGGLTTGGLDQTDIGNKSAFGGIALDLSGEWRVEGTNFKGVGVVVLVGARVPRDRRMVVCRRVVAKI